MTAREQGSWQAALHYELCEAEDSSFLVEERWALVHEHANATERHLAQAGQLLAVAQDKLPHGK